MPTLRIDKDLKDRAYFLTFTIIEWIDVFTSRKYFDSLINALKFYQKELNIRIFGYVIMSNHIHLLAQCKDMIRFIKGFKSYTTKEIKKLLQNDNRKYLFKLLKDSKINRNRQKFQIWESKNWPELVESEGFFNQKINYIHENPVIKGYVDKEEDWLYSSARNYILDDHSVIKVDIEGVLD